MTTSRQTGSERYRLSRTKLALFLECPRCFHLSVHGGIARPDGPPLKIYLTIDTLLKREFDDYRVHGHVPAICASYGLDVVPLQHRDLERWRDFHHGLSRVHRASGIEVYGAIDDLWRHRDGRVSVVDYKATSVVPPVAFTSEHYDGYRRQLEIYRWLLAGTDIPLSDDDYWLIANVDPKKATASDCLPLELSVVPYRGATDWIDDALREIADCLRQSDAPTPAKDCRWCRYRREALAEESRK